MIAPRPTAADRGRLEARGDELADPLVSAGAVEVARVLPERLEQVALAEDENMVEAPAAHAAQEPAVSSPPAQRAARQDTNSLGMTWQQPRAVRVRGRPPSEARRVGAPPGVRSRR